MAKWLSALKKTRSAVADAFTTVFTSNKIDEDTLEDLEGALIHADIAPRFVAELLDALVAEHKKSGAESAQATLRDMLVGRFAEMEPFVWSSDSTRVFLMVGINGSGKTTTCAKLANYIKMERGDSVVLGAADTFRAAGSSQLKVWGDRIEVDVITGKQGSDAASVAYDSLDSALAKKAKYLFVDTAGRMHNRGPLMDELKKIHRALGKRWEEAPQDVWIVLDASLGQNAINQARQFHKEVPLTGVVITKLDGSAKGGFLFSVWEELGVPITYVGLGEGEEDLVPFDADEFVNGVLGIEPPAEDD